MHQAVRTVLNSIDSARRNAIARFIKSLHLQSPAHGSLRLVRRLLLNSGTRLLIAGGPFRYTKDRVASYKIRFLAAGEGCSYAILKSGSSEMCCTFSSSENFAFFPQRGQAGRSSPRRIQMTFSEQPLCSQRYTPDTGVVLPLSSVNSNALMVFP